LEGLFWCKTYNAYSYRCVYNYGMDNNTNTTNDNTQTTGQTSDSVKTEPVEIHQDYRTLIAISAYIIFFIPLLTDQRKDPFVSFHTSQGFVLFVANLVSLCVSALPIIGLVSIILYPIILVLTIIGIINAAQHREKELPIIGHFGRNIHL
jgi:uncharacterized membrane protein